MKAKIFRKLQSFFVISLCLCMLLGIVLTLLQFIGAIIQIPALIERSQDVLFKPLMASAASFALFSFFASYFQPSGPVNDEEAEEI